VEGSSRCFSEPAGVFLRVRFYLGQPSSASPSRAETFPRRLITPRRSSHKTPFNLNQRERAYIALADAPRPRTALLFLSLLSILLPFSPSCARVTKTKLKGAAPRHAASRRQPLLILRDAALINSRRYSGVYGAARDATPANLYLALKGFARLINNEHRGYSRDT